MANPLIRFAAALSPTPQPSVADYQGVQYHWKLFTFRPGLLKTDAILLGLTIGYVLIYLMGKSVNSRRANVWYHAHLPLLASQFSKPTQNGLYADGSSDLVNFSTGRRAVAALHTIFRMLPRHDFIQQLWQFGWTSVDLKYRPEDRITLDFELDAKAAAAFPDFVWAVVAKDELGSIKDERWDLTFGKTTENKELPQSLTVMSEVADVTENILKPYGSFSLPKLLSDPNNLKYFRSLSITDQPAERPSKPLRPEDHKKFVILTLACPPSSDASVTVPLVSGIFQLIDALAATSGKPLLNLRPETKSKLKKRREELDAELKADSEKDAKEAAKEAQEAKDAAKRRAEQERIANLPASEQAKILERERKRTLRKGQGKVARK